MINELITNVTLKETRVALLENGIVTEIFIERKSDRSIVGNIYKGKVIRILPGMQAAFVDIGFERSAFLYVSDIYEDRIFEDMDYEDERSDKDIQNIEDILKKGEEILIQIFKEPIDNKGPRVTTNITLPGHYLVFMPMNSRVGVSRRINNIEERKRLRDIMLSVKPPNMGVIARTTAEGKDESDFKSDMDFLIKLWENILKKKNSVSAPFLVHEDLSLILRVIRDIKVDRIIIDSEEEYNKVMSFTEKFMPNVKYDIEIYKEEVPIFYKYGIDAEIDNALKNKVWLKSGGYIVIDQAEALVAIDVNTGKYVGKRNFEDTILKTNLEAVKEIAYQLRLRNLGGIIIIDFIDMEKEENREKVFKALEEALKKDRQKTTIISISELGIVEMTRKRNRESLKGVLMEPCFYCDGRGDLKSKITICYDIFQAIRIEALRNIGDTISIIVHSAIADILFYEEKNSVENLEKEINKEIIIKVDKKLHIEEYYIK